MKSHNTSVEFLHFDVPFLKRRLSFSILIPPTINIINKNWYKILFNVNWCRMKEKNGYGLTTGHCIILGFGIYFSWYIKH